MFLVFCQCLVNVLVAWAGELWVDPGKKFTPSLLLLPPILCSELVSGPDTIPRSLWVVRGAVP